MRQLLGVLQAITSCSSRIKVRCDATLVMLSLKSSGSNNSRPYSTKMQNVGVRKIQPQEQQLEGILLGLLQLAVLAA